MRSWMILIELTFSILLLTIFFLFITYNFKLENTPYITYFTSDYIRKLTTSCNDPTLQYTIYNFSTGKTYVCIFGTSGNITDIRGTKVIDYIVSGKNSYDPYIVSIYQ